MIGTIVAAAAGPVGVAILGLLLWRGRARRRMGATWRALQAAPGIAAEPGRASASDDGIFRTELVSELPEPARRYLLRAIAPGTPLHRRVELGMTGSIALRPGDGLLPMEATQVIAWPEGYVWKARVGSSAMRISGFDLYHDGEAEMRWWLWGLVPIVRERGANIARSAAGRLPSEAVLILTALLPDLGAAWEPVSEEAARASVRVGGETLHLTLTVSPEGRLRRVEFLRLHPEEDGRGLVPVPWRVEVVEERTFGGLTIPGRLRAFKYAGRADEHEFVVQDFARARWA